MTPITTPIAPANAECGRRTAGGARAAFRVRAGGVPSGRVRVRAPRPNVEAHGHPDPRSIPRRAVAALRVPVALALLPLAPAAARADDSTGVMAIMERIDRLYRSNSSHARITMEIVTPHWKRTLRMEAWTKGTERMLIRIEAPRKERGVATLRIGSEMWNYLPRTDKVIKVPPSMMMSSWMGSDFTNDDIVREFSLLTDYTYEEVPPSGEDSGRILIRAVPRPDLPVVWSEILLSVDAEERLPAWERYYDEQGDGVRVIRYSEVRTFSGRRVPAVLEVVPAHEEGHRTVIRYEELELDIPADDDLFSLARLRRGE